MDEVALRDRALVRDLIVAVFRTNGAIIANGDRLVADLHLTSSLWQVLDALERAADKLTVSEIARGMGLTRQSVQRSADILAARGYVAYQDNPTHKRVHLVCLTAAGHTALAAIHARELSSIARVLGRLEPSQVVELTRLLVTLTEELAR